jgi:hypothetical protein
MIDKLWKQVAAVLPYRPGDQGKGSRVRNNCAMRLSERLAPSIMSSIVYRNFGRMAVSGPDSWCRRRHE